MHIYEMKPTKSICEWEYTILCIRMWEYTPYSSRRVGWRGTDLTAKLSRHIEQLPLQVEEPGPVLLHGASLEGAELLQDLLQPLSHLLRLDGGLGDGAAVEIMIPAVQNWIIKKKDNKSQQSFLKSRNSWVSIWKHLGLFIYKLSSTFGHYKDKVKENLETIGKFYIHVYCLTIWVI